MMQDAARSKGEDRIFFQHVMKTAGTSFARVVESNTLQSERYPGPRGPGRAEQYYVMSKLIAHHRSHPDTRIYMGHFPSVAAEIVNANIRLTILREPIERIISAMHHFKRTDPRLHGMDLEEIYHDDLTSAFYLRNHQVKMFAMTGDDPLESLMDVIDVDSSRLELAKQALDRFDFVGLTHRYQSFVEVVCSSLGWASRPTARLQVGSRSEPIAASLRTQIESDNGPDLEFFDHALSIAGPSR